MSDPSRGRLLAVIPARGGSKRIPLKNIRELAGRPMIAYSIEAALSSSLFDRVVVSTDSDEIAEVAVALGAEVPFLRAAPLADDITPVSLATCDMLERLDPDGAEYDLVAQLMPNCPLRTDADIIESHRVVVESGSAAQVSVFRYSWMNPWWAMSMRADCTLEPVFPERLQERSQDQPELVCPSGAVWWARTSVLRSARTFNVEGRTGFVLPWEHAVDIDDEDDWRMAEVLVRVRQGA